MKITHSETEIIKERLELLEEEYKLNNQVEMLVLTKKLLNFITETKKLKIQFNNQISPKEIVIEGSTEGVFSAGKIMKIEQEDINNFKKIMEKIRQDLSKTEPESQLVDKKSFINGILYHL